MELTQKIYNKRSEINLGYFKEGEVEKICLNCPLPAKTCNLDTCKRYNNEIKKLKEKHKNEKCRKTKKPR